MAVGIRRMYFINADVTVNDTTPVSTGIIIPVQPGQTLLFNGQLLGSSGNITSAWAFYCTRPTGVFPNIVMTQIGTADNGGTVDGQPLSVDSVDGVFSSGASGGKLFGITGSIIGGVAAGNFELFMAKNNANAGAFVLQKNSFIEITVV